jgi:hypothetical protein
VFRYYARFTVAKTPEEATLGLKASGIPGMSV